MQLLNLKIYEPTQKLSDDALHLIDENGLDWYESQSKFKDNTLKIACDDQAIIRSSSFDVSMLWPVSLSVFEVDKNKIPKGFPEQPDDNWIFDGKKLAPREVPKSELLAQAEETRAQLMAEANQKITPLQDASDLDIATEDELIELKAWKTYRVLLSRVDISSAPDIDWPPLPA
ncbi:tail fiber assembly protein [Hafnia alvei]|uniref:Phage tail fiber protein n=1 Tax=Hafnia alvei FB1 TaxID=1453496 RepID=A0A097R2L3_HAFAL|nr:tail fiber assembly protein [Hafnia alvei]AIU72964.1 phage tail fiber protein [Hafnia alvei FB1]TBM15331.1 tail fiber assembly protein [Hafnia alvei]TBM15561.1 tail fiber assembly protein [Hafnia alvei]